MADNTMHVPDLLIFLDVFETKKREVRGKFSHLLYK
jgi:hypothetical protein